MSFFSYCCIHCGTIVKNIHGRNQPQLQKSSTPYPLYGYWTEKEKVKEKVKERKILTLKSARDWESSPVGAASNPSSLGSSYKRMTSSHPAQVACQKQEGGINAVLGYSVFSAPLYHIAFTH